MKYMLTDLNGVIFAAGIMKCDIEKALRSNLWRSTRSFIVAAQLLISFNAKVLRKSGEPEIIEIESGGKIIRLFRDTVNQIGDVAVSCSPRGDAVNVDTFNIKFRDYTDEFTDRGIVWVTPGNPARMQLDIKSKALETSGKVQEIIEEALSSLAEKLLDPIELALL